MQPARLEQIVGNVAYFDDGSTLVMCPECVSAPRIFTSLDSLCTEPTRWLIHAAGGDPRHGTPVFEGYTKRLVQAVVESFPRRCDPRDFLAAVDLVRRMADLKRQLAASDPEDAA